ncbi:acetyltransferase [Sphingomonas gei]|nr:acetyltransferase [Sphingomonas gei]
MPSKSLVIFGAGGHAKVVLDALFASGGDFGRIELRDGDPELWGKLVLGLAIGPLHISSELAETPCHIAIGNADIRRRIAAEIHSAGGNLVTIAHPRAIVSPHATLGAGSFIAAGAIIAPNAVVGEAVIVNHSAIVDHDCLVGAFSHIAPGAVLGGGVTIGRRTLIGAGATILPGCSIGSETIIGAGAVVTRTIGDREKVIMVPASKVV